MRVLVVDDSSTMRRIIINTLRKLGYEDTCEAGDGREALKSLTATPADMVVTDWNMPEMTGPEFVEALRAMPDLAKIPAKDILKALKSGDADTAAEAISQDILNSAKFLMASGHFARPAVRKISGLAA